MIKIQIMKHILLIVITIIAFFTLSCKERSASEYPTTTELSAESIAGETNEYNNNAPTRNHVENIQDKDYVASVLTPTSINLIEKNGKQEIIIFGESYDMVVSRMTQYIGAPSSDKIEDDCKGQNARIVRWDEYITLTFVNRNNQWQFAGWSLQERDENATKFKMTSGLTVGIERNNLSTPMDQKPTVTSIGYLHRPDSVTAILKSAEADATVTYLFSGVNCVPIKEGVLPQSKTN